MLNVVFREPPEKTGEGSGTGIPVGGFHFGSILQQVKRKEREITENSGGFPPKSRLKRKMPGSNRLNFQWVSAVRRFFLIFFPMQYSCSLIWFHLLIVLLRNAGDGWRKGKGRIPKFHSVELQKSGLRRTNISSVVLK